MIISAMLGHSSILLLPALHLRDDAYDDHGNEHRCLQVFPKFHDQSHPRLAVLVANVRVTCGVMGNKVKTRPAVNSYAWA
jgi:hypothetical protein